MRLSGLGCIALFAVGGVCALPVWAQVMTTQQAMHTRIDSLYNFSPSKVTDAIRSSKSKEMDGFWTEVTGNKEAELPLLRVELANPANPRFFFQDGSALLLSLSQTPGDEKLVAAAIARADLSDVQSHEYLFEVHSLAVKGIDVTPAALHMLDDSKFTVFLPEHAYRLDQSACLEVALMPLPNDVWLPAVMERFRTEHDATALKSLLLILFYAQTNEADRLILAAANAQNSPKEIREFADTIVKHEKELGVGKQPSAATEAKVREERQKRMFAVSDEAMEDMNELTEKIARSRSLSK